MDNLITEARRKLGLNAGQLGERLGVHRTTVNRWEAGEVPISGPAERLLEQMLTENHDAPKSNEVAQ